MFTLKNVISVIKKNKVAASVVDMVINKDAERSFPMNKYEILSKLGNKEGNADIVKEVRKGMTKRNITNTI